MGLPSTARRGENNGAILNWPARARNSSSSWQRRSADDGSNRRTTSSSASRNSAPCGCPRGVGAPMVGAARMRVAAHLGLDAVGRLLESAGRRSLPATSTHRSGGSWSSPRLSSPPGCPCGRDAHELPAIGEKNNTKLPCQNYM